jgi:uncharacterized membrane protein
MFKKERVEALSDGVIAIVITLMFLGFEESYGSIRNATSSSDVWAFIVSQWPRFAGSCLSFVLVGNYWLMHHVVFHYIKRADRIFIAVNAMFLMSIAVVPVATDWLVESLHHEFNAILVFYALTHLVANLLLLAMWAWAVAGRRLTSASLSDDTVKSLNVQILVGPAMCLAGVLVSYAYVPLALIVLTSMPLVYLWPRKTDAHWMLFEQREAVPTRGNLRSHRGQVDGGGRRDFFSSENESGLESDATTIIGMVSL